MPLVAVFLWLPQQQAFAVSQNFLHFLSPAEYHYAGAQRIILAGGVSAGHNSPRLHRLHGALRV